MAGVIIFDVTLEHNTMLMQFYGSWDASSLPSAQAELVHISASEDKHNSRESLGCFTCLFLDLKKYIFFIFFNLKRWHML